MPNRHRPRRGSLQFWPRKRAKREYAKVKTWASLKDVKILGFAGYKAGMTHILMKDASASHTKGEEISQPVTIIECPPMKVLGIRFYKKAYLGKKVVFDLYAEKIDKEVARKIKIKNKGREPEDFDDLKLIVYTQPRLTGLAKKKPEIFELGVSGDKAQQLEYAKLNLGKEIKIKDTFKDGQLLDIHAITTGRGFQGTVKRFGVVIRQHKSEKTKRGIATLGAWTPTRVSWRVPQAGKMGYNMRTMYNNWLFKIGVDPSEINPKGGFIRYGVVKNDYLIMKGSVPGPKKRMIILTEPIRQKKRKYIPEITYISKESKQ